MNALMQAGQQTNEEETEFWATHDSTEYINWDKAEKITVARPHLPWAVSWCIFGGNDYDCENMKGRKNYRNK
ncbi:MAG: BrnA antitoxin family protein [Desulfotignum sp.]|nr:BrnA antitoxin family protein [Desulfotignum sp.]MCF8138127.1 BrnA antitoxin family protein [Desulfotignum sp.]